MLKHTLLYGLIILFLSSRVFSQTPSFSDKTEKLLTYLHENNRFAGTVFISQGDTVLYHKTFPVKGQSSGQETYRIGSISKMFTAVMIYQLMEEGKLSNGDKLAKFFPQVPNAKSITIKQLLGHQSGITDIVSDDDFDQFKSAAITRDEMLSRITSSKPAFKPGKRTEYSNTNYILLGYIIEDITKTTFRQALAERISNKLSLTDTYLDEDTSPNPCYMFDGKDWGEVSATTNAAVTFSSGGVTSTVEDLHTFIQAIFTGQLITSASLDSMKTFSTAATGHGIFYTPFDANKGYGHTGRIDEFRSAVTYFPADSLCFVMCFNGLNYQMNNIALAVLSYYYLEDFPFPEISSMQIPADSLKKYEGIYRLKLLHIIPLTKVKITGGKGVLFTATEKNFEEEKTIVEPIAKDVFKNFSYNSTLRFTYKNNGTIKGCYLEQGKNKLYCKKLN